ncbi:hypothetical protein FB451DRAFT_1515683 [Mycena latifolia]|nr:hypothetical protein FB451DRAFT_1515683 [Mycena latifolia]
MPINVAEALNRATLAAELRTAVIVGGTLGIGAAVARRLAKLGCRRIIILGRNQPRAEGVLEDLRKLVPKGTTIEVTFVKGDLVDSKSMRAAADSLERAAGDARIDYLVMTQNGVPTGTINENSDGCDTAFAIQAVSRFALTYLLTARGSLAPNAIVISIANTSQSLDDLSADDLPLKAKHAAGRRKAGLFLDQSKRDSSVMDSFIEEFNIRYPQYSYYSLHPGLVSSEQFSISKFPPPLNIGVWIGVKLIGTTPEQYANIPVYVSTLPSRYYGAKLNPLQIGNWASNPKNREAVWVKLTEMIGEK